MDRWWRSFPAWIALIAVLGCTYVAFRPSLDNGFVNWDDPAYVTENPELRHGNSWGYAPAIHRIVHGNYHPLTMLTLAWDYRHAVRIDPDLSAPAARPFHRTNLLLHLANTALAFVLAWLLSRGRLLVATFCAAFFAVHPLHVESVAWISARKDVLYALFYLAAAIAYLKYRENRSVWIYCGCLFLFLLALLSKPAAVVLPLSLVLIDIYLDGRFRGRALNDKLPFLAASIVIGIVTLQAQTATGAVHVASFEPFERVLLAGYAFVMYAWKLVAPVALSAFYPYPAKIGIGHVAGLLAALAILAVAAWSYRRDRTLFFAVGFFAVNLVLVLQLVPVGSAIIADRYTYVAYLGPFFAVGVGLDRLLRRSAPARYALLAAVLVAALACAWSTHARTRVWADSETLWSDVIDEFPNRAAKAYSGRGVYFRQNGELGKALDDYERAIEIDPTYYKTYLSRANLYRERGKLSGDATDFRRALADLDRAVSLEAGDPDVYNSRALAHYYLGDVESALDDFDRALRRDPAHLDTLKNRARLWRGVEEFERAYRDYSSYLDRRADDPIVRLLRADTALLLGRVGDALEDFTRCIERSPGFADCYIGRAQVYDRLGRRTEAERDRQTAGNLPE